jgi:hypothetical protein
MSAKDIDSASKNHEKISDQMKPITFNSIRKILPDKAIQYACNKVGYTHRRRMITPIITILHIILAAIWPEESFAASWQVLWTSFSSRFKNYAGKSPSLGSVAKARTRLPLSLWDTLFERVSQQEQRLSEKHDTWRGLREILLDGTCLSMSDTARLKRVILLPVDYNCTTTGGPVICHFYKSCRFVSVVKSASYEK